MKTFFLKLLVTEMIGIAETEQSSVPKQLQPVYTALLIAGENFLAELNK